MVHQLILGVGATVGGGLASTVMVDLNNRVAIAGTGGELEDSSNFVFDGSQLILGLFGGNVSNICFVAESGYRTLDSLVLIHF